MTAEPFRGGNVTAPPTFEFGFDRTSPPRFERRSRFGPSVSPAFSGLRLGLEMRPEEGLMPHYEYLCTECNKKFSVVLTLDEHEKGKVKCPKCGGTKVEQEWAAFYATTSKKS